MPTDTRIIDLEARIAHQDQAIIDLSDEIYQQQKQIEQLEATCKYLLEKSRQSPATEGSHEDGKPPHY